MLNSSLNEAPQHPIAAAPDGPNGSTITTIPSSFFPIKSIMIGQGVPLLDGEVFDLRSVLGSTATAHWVERVEGIFENISVRVDFGARFIVPYAVRNDPADSGIRRVAVKLVICHFTQVYIPDRSVSMLGRTG